MELQILFKTARSAVFEIQEGGVFYTNKNYKFFLNDKEYGNTERVINGIYELKPDSRYKLTVKSEQSESSIFFQTEKESFSLDVRDFGAKGDGLSDDTCFIQAAIMSCPIDGRIIIPAGTYRITTLFLKSNIKLELGKGAILKAFTEREKRPIIPGRIQSYDEEDTCYLGTWEGNPLTMFSAVIQGMNLENVVIYGQGEIDGNADITNWWDKPKEKNLAYRPRLIFLSNCKNVVIEGVVLINSPSWTLHPYFCSELKFISLSILNPKNSPNTDALNPESCNNVEITGVFFSVGDDCIAIKSGKIYFGRKFKTPSQNITIRQCCMQDGHGSVTIGSENAGGVRNITVRDCLFLHTDRGLRVKTRRGRGEDAIIDNIVFDNIRMDGVMTPIVINCFYFCDPDGHSAYVQNKAAYPVDERTPVIKKLAFHNIDCINCHVAAVYIYGLPERKIEELQFENVTVQFDEKAIKGYPDMMDDLEETSRLGVFIQNVEKLTLSEVTIKGQDGEAYHLKNNDNIKGLQNLKA